MTQTLYLVINGKNEVFSNVRDIKKLKNLNIMNIRDFAFEERKRAKEVLDYIRAFKNYDDEEIEKHVRNFVSRKMDVVSREEWTIKKVRVNYSMKLVE